MCALRRLLVLSALACSCSAGDDSSTAPARPYSAFDEITTSNQACLPRAFQADATGRVPLRYVVALPANDSKCSYGTAVNEATRSALANDLAATVGVACDMPQLTTHDYSGADCTKSLSPGWCYVPAGQGVGCVAHAYLSLGAADVNGPGRRFVVLEP